MQLTQDQQKVVGTRNVDILVSAAAGSGKTAVLVQRILSRITDPEKPVDIDRMLIVTFTNAAAAEMRERIHVAILERLAQNPQDENLQRQSSLIHNAQITTIDSFCLFLLRNHFQEIGLDPGFRIADPGEIKLLEKEALAETMESFYAKITQEDQKGEEVQAYIEFCEAYAPDGKDRQIEQLVEQLYHCSMAHPWPDEWFAKCREELADASKDALWQSQWMQFLWEIARADLSEALETAGRALTICNEPDGPYMYGENVEQDRKLLSYGLDLLQKPQSRDSYEEIHRWVTQCQFSRLSAKKDDTVNADKKEAVKGLRQSYKDVIKKLTEELFAKPAEEILRREERAASLQRVLIELTEAYTKDLARRKEEKNLIDFADAEHMALRVLLQDGEPTQTALGYRDYFEEVMIDEYQDSNMVQEILLRAVSKESAGCHDRFMVGDMKQSIYKFRLARPEIFMEKYQAYQKDTDDHTLICLKKNFRSRPEVLESTNLLFEKMMRSEVGGIAYDSESALYPGAQFPDASDVSNIYQTELCLYQKDGARSADSRRAEARMIAQRIKQLVGSFPIVDTARQKQCKEGDPVPMRMASYRDIVILTRSEKNVADTIRSVLASEGIPVYVTSREGYFSAQEISMLMDFLRVLNNPYDDIAMCSTLRSVFFDMDNEEIATLVAGRGDRTMYECLKNAAAGQEPGAMAILNTIQKYRKLAMVCSMPQLVSQILQDYQYIEYVSAMPAGQQRKANVEMFVEKTVDFEKTSMHGLFHFIRYMEQLKKYQVDFGEAATLSEAADVVRIMTIHKSKGLEFPICFVACLDKKFNTEDQKKPVLMDADWGIASDAIDVDIRLRAKTLKKRLLAIRAKRELVGEELRVLYVAMTRAREKLILTGCVDEVAEKLPGYQQMAGGAAKAPVRMIAAANSMLDFALIAYAMEESGSFAMLREVTKADLVLTTAGEQISAGQRQDMLEALCHGAELPDEASEQMQEACKDLTQKFAFRYPYENLEGLYTKTSVSELKRAAMEDAGMHPAFETDDKEEAYIPAFMQEEKVQSGTQYGSAMHRFLELLDFAKYAAVSVTTGELESDLEAFGQAERILPEYADVISVPKIAAFLQSDAAERMMRAASEGKLRKEQPFVLSLPACRLNGQFPDEEQVLIQGIIDVYWEEEDGIVILDYKTDRVKTMEELYQRYAAQLDYYEEAVTRITGRPVKEKILYSFALQEVYGWK